MTDPLARKRARRGLCPNCGFWPSMHDSSSHESPNTCDLVRVQVLGLIDKIMREVR